MNNTSQLAGFAKCDDLLFFLRSMCLIEYAHLPELAPTTEMLGDYKKRKGSWAEYETRFLVLIAERKIKDRVSPALLDNSCLLGSEARPEQCHRRLIAE